MDEYETTKEIRKYSVKVPIIAITAFTYVSDETDHGKWFRQLYAQTDQRL